MPRPALPTALKRWRAAALAELLAAAKAFDYADNRRREFPAGQARAAELLQAAAVEFNTADTWEPGLDLPPRILARFPTQ